MRRNLACSRWLKGSVLDHFFSGTDITEEEANRVPWKLKEVMKIMLFSFS
jgi:hypothetical protein